MEIVVCIKQIPDVDDIKWTKENNLDRLNMLSKLNPCDEFAIDCAVKIKSQFNDVKLTAITMGPNQAKDILHYALAKGMDRVILLSDKNFSGSDTLITAKILSTAIKKYVSNYNLILTGQKAQDGDTEQVPISMAQMLSIPDITNVIKIHNADKNIVIVSQKLKNEVNMYEVSTPCLLAIKEGCADCVKAKIEDYIKAQNTMIETYSAQDLEIPKENSGIIGSPTLVYRAFRPEIQKDTVEITEDYAQNILDLIFKG